MEKLGYRPGLDGLRAVAVAVVVTVHMFPTGWTPGGWVGVDVFFVLSGFLITSLIVGELDATGGFRVGAFLWRRMVRLAPALIVLLGFVVLMSAQDPVSMAAVPLVGLYVASFARAAGQGLGLLDHAWSLAVEEQFYLLWAVAAPVVWRLRRPVLVLGSVVAAVTVWRTWLLVGTDAPVWFRLDTRLDGLLAGAALAFVLARRSWLPTLPLRVAAWMALVGCVVVGPWNGIGIPVATVASVVLVAHAAQADQRWLGRLRWVGRRSYGIYLWHYPLFVLAERQIGTAAWVIAIPVTLVAAAASYDFVEMPLRRRLGRKPDADERALVQVHRLGDSGVLVEIGREVVTHGSGDDDGDVRGWVDRCALKLVDR